MTLSLKHWDDSGRPALEPVVTDNELVLQRVALGHGPAKIRCKLIAGQGMPNPEGIAEAVRYPMPQYVPSARWDNGWFADLSLIQLLEIFREYEPVTVMKPANNSHDLRLILKQPWD